MIRIIEEIVDNKWIRKEQSFLISHLQIFSCKLYFNMKNVRINILVKIIIGKTQKEDNLGRVWWWSLWWQWLSGHVSLSSLYPPLKLNSCCLSEIWFVNNCTLSSSCLLCPLKGFPFDDFFGKKCSFIQPTPLSTDWVDFEFSKQALRIQQHKF